MNEGGREGDGWKEQGKKTGIGRVQGKVIDNRCTQLGAFNVECRTRERREENRGCPARLKNIGPLSSTPSTVGCYPRLYQELTKKKRRLPYYFSTHIAGLTQYEL